jgi:cytochrome c oxidase cbb3-type subunit 4
MDINDLRAMFTVLVIVMFAGIVWWAFSAKRKDQFDEAARSVLDDDLPDANPRAGHPHN